MKADDAVSAKGNLNLCLILRGLGAVTGKIKLALAAGKANPAPPVGPALGSKVGQLGCAASVACLRAACRPRTTNHTLSWHAGCQHHGILQGVQRPNR